MQIKELQSPSLLPTLEALDAEFGREDGQYAARRRKEGGASMSAKFTGRYRQGTGGRAGNSAQALSGSAPGSRSASAQTGPSDTAALTVSAGALTSREVYQVHPRWDLICHGRMNTAISRKTRGENPVRRADCTPRGGR